MCMHLAQVACLSRPSSAFYTPLPQILAALGVQFDTSLRRHSHLCVSCAVYILHLVLEGFSFSFCFLFFLFVFVFV